MGVIGWVLFGFAVGLIARAILPGRDSMGIVGTTLLGVLGALLGGWIGTALGWFRSDQGSSFIAATAGAVLVLYLYNSVVRRRAGSRSPLSTFSSPASRAEEGEKKSEGKKDYPKRAA